MKLYAIAAGWMAAVAIAAAVSVMTPAITGSRPLSGAHPLDRFDAVYYRAWTEGAAVDNQSAFFPIYSYAIKPVTNFFHPDFSMAASGVNVILVFVMAVLWQHIGQVVNHGRSNHRIWLAFLLLPASFSFLAPYPTALLITGALAAWLGYLRNQSNLLLIGAAVAALAHPTGLIVLGAAVAHGIHRRLRSTGGWLVVVATVTVLVVTVLPTYFAGRRDYASFENVNFLQLGWWFMTNAKNVVDLIVIQTVTILQLGLVVYAIIRTWNTHRWINLIGIGVLVMSFFGSTWTGLARYELLLFTVPVVVAQLPQHQYRGLLMLFGSLQLAWIYIFASGNFYV